MSYQKRLRPFLEYLESLGLEVLEITTSGSSHYKITVTLGGNRRFFMAPYSPSDRRAFENWKSNIRKWIKEVEHDAQANRTGSKPQLHKLGGRSSTPLGRERGGGAMGARG